MRLPSETAIGSEPHEAAEKLPTAPTPLFRSFFMGGFECSTHYRSDGYRLDITAATRHDQRCAEDYRLLWSVGIQTVRDGARWHLIEPTPRSYDWSSLIPMAMAAEQTGTEVIWDLLHYGWPDHLDLWSPMFVESFAHYAGQTARMLRELTGRTPWFVPINEISFMAWGAGDVGVLHPFAIGRGEELKRQLARAAIAAIHAIREIDPGARFLQVEPIIHVIPQPYDPFSAERAARHTEAQFAAFDMLSGRICPELGGSEDCLDVVGLNYYCHNQWMEGGPPIPWNEAHPLYQPPHELFVAVHRRYGRPMIIAETGIEAELRPSWFTHVCAEVRRAALAGADFRGICLYPVMNHPGWADDRHCPNGLIDYDRQTFDRMLDMPLATTLHDMRAQMKTDPKGALAAPDGNAFGARLVTTV